MSLVSVLRWRDRLRELDPSPGRGPLSEAGIRLVWREALDALTDESLANIAELPGEPWSTAAMAAPRTVPTAAVEWCAVWLTRGTRVLLKPPSGDPGVIPLLAEAARAEGLPLVVSGDRGSLLDAELAVVQGADESVSAVRAARGARPTLGFGHRFSVAWMSQETSAAGVAEDLARFDGRGCMSPTAVFTDLPPEEATRALAEALSAAEDRVPRGALTPSEGARLREERARSRALGSLSEGAGWSVLLRAGPPHGEPPGLPRAPFLIPVPDLGAFERWLQPHRPRLSTVGTDTPLDVPGARVCPTGEMQRPPLRRLHDGVDWVDLAAARPPASAR